MLKEGQHAPKWSEALAAIKAQGRDETVAEAIANASADEGRRWMMQGKTFLFVNPDNYQISEVTQGVIPLGMVLVELPEAQVAQSPAPVAEKPHESEAPAPKTVTEAAAEVVAEEMTTSDNALLMQDNLKPVAPKKKKKGAEQEPDPNDPNEAAEKKKGQESVRTGFFSELMPLTESVMDGAAHEIDVTLIRAGWSANGKYYSRETLGRAVPAFEGARAYVNHPTVSEGKERPERDVRDMAGYYKNVRQADDGSLKGTLKLIGRNGDDLMPLVNEALTNKPDLLGLSINALGKTKMGEAEGRKGVLVEEIVSARSTSTDIVTTPAAGGKFERLMASDNEFTTDLLQALEYDEWRESRPDFVARFQKETRTARVSELAEAQNQEVVTLREQVALLETTRKELEESQKRATTALTDKLNESLTRVSELVADSKLKESKLPDAWKTELKPQLLTLSESEVDVRLESERKKYFGIKMPVQVLTAGATPITNGVSLTESELAVAGALGVNPLNAPYENESPAQWAQRVKSTR